MVFDQSIKKWRVGNLDENRINTKKCLLTSPVCTCASIIYCNQIDAWLLQFFTLTWKHQSLFFPTLATAMWAHRRGRDAEKCEQFIQLTPQSQGLPDRQSVNNILHILTWFHSSVVNHEQMGQCDCHVNNVLRSIIWGTVAVTSHVASHGKRLKVGYDLSWITGRLCNLLRLGDTPHCILKHSLNVFGRPTRESREDITVCKRWQLSAHSEWCPICLLFLLEAQFQFHFVCWQISSAQTRQQWISCKVVCLNHSGRNVHTLFTRSHKIGEIASCLDKPRPWRGNLSSGAWHGPTCCQTLPPSGVWKLCSRIFYLLFACPHFYHLSSFKVLKVTHRQRVSDSIIHFCVVALQSYLIF